MPRIIYDDDVICMKCNQLMEENSNRFGEPNCDCHEHKWVHVTTQSDECEMDTQTL